MTKATDKALGELHGKLAKHMLEALTASETAADLLDEYEDELPGPVVLFLTRAAESNPALLTAISKFLKDNNITCAVEDSKEMSELEKTLKSKQKRVGNVVPMHE